MNIRFKSLALQWKLDREVLDLEHQVLFFHGQISAGKSTIARLIDFCLGGSLEMTIALQQEFVSASLIGNIGTFEVLLERTSNAETVQVTWRDQDGKSASVLAPIQSKKTVIWEGGIESLSDLLFHLLDIEPLRVKRSKTDEDSPLVRLSFRNFMWYCYLEQEHLDSSFYRLEDPIRANSSKDVLRFVFGYYSEKLSSLEYQLEKAKLERQKKLGTATELRSFLERFGYGSTDSIESQIEVTKIELDKLQEKRKSLEGSYHSDTHSSDELRDKIRGLIKPLEELQEAQSDLIDRIEEQKSLRAELISSKFKLARVESASSVFGNVKFELCPACGNTVKYKSSDDCYLCHQSTSNVEKGPEPEEIRVDLDSRIADLDGSIQLHEQALVIQKRKLDNLLKEKQAMDSQLQGQLRNYDSAFLSRFREVDREVATLEERLKSFDKIKLMPEEIKKLEEDADQIAADEQRLKREVETEKGTLTKAGEYVNELEETFMQSLLTINLPVVSTGDVAKITLKNWEVQIWHQGEANFPWNFYNAGSGGVKTLFNVCYLLSIHLVASRNNLPLPSFIMIDTPMQNIGENVNKELFEKFYDYLYTLAAGPLAGTQFIIIDKDFVKPKSDALDILDRYMTPDQEAHPPLIRYFRLTGITPK
jgi:hypothetical protein